MAVTTPSVRNSQVVGHHINYLFEASGPRKWQPESHFDDPAGQDCMAKMAMGKIEIYHLSIEMQMNANQYDTDISDIGMQPLRLPCVIQSYVKSTVVPTRASMRVG